MRRLIISCAALVALFCVTLYNTHNLNNYTQELTELLTQAEDCASQGDWDGAAKKTERALERWNDRNTYLHMTLQHRDTDDILLQFQEVRQLIAHQEDGGEYAAANAQLITRIELLYEMEQFSLANLL